jgi:hypothetical protein
MCKGGGSSSTIDPAIKNMLMQNYARAQSVANRPYQPYTGPLTADLTPAQYRAGGLLESAPFAGQDALRSGISAAQTAANYRAPEIAPPSAGVPLAAPAATADPARIDANALPLLSAPDGVKQLSGYLNPYTQDVANTTMAELDRQNKIALNNAHQNASAENAFGGDRTAVADALTNDDYARAKAAALANLNAQGFNTAAGLLQNNQRLNLAAGEGNLNAALSAAAQNAANRQQANIFNANAQNSLGEFNAGAANQMTLANLNAILQAAQANQNASNAAKALNLQSAGLLGTLGGDQSANYLAGTNALNNWGAQQQQTIQNALNAAYQQYLNQFNYPVQMQNVLNSALSGGMGAGTTNPSATGGLLGSLAALGNVKTSSGDTLLGAGLSALGGLLGL